MGKIFMICPVRSRMREEENDGIYRIFRKGCKHGGSYYGKWIYSFKRQIIKINDMRKVAVVIREKDRDNQIVPVIYLKSYFEMYRQGKNMGGCIMRITEDYREYIKEKKKRRECMRWCLTGTRPGGRSIPF